MQSRRPCLLMFISFVLAVLSTSSSTTADTRSLDAVTDDISGVTFALPKTLLSEEIKTSRGRNWSSSDKSINIDTFVLPSNDLKQVFENLKSIKGRRVTESRLSADHLLIKGTDSHGDRLHVEARKDADAIRGFSVVYAAKRHDEYGKLVDAVAQSFNKVPGALPADTVSKTTNGDWDRPGIVYAVAGVASGDTLTLRREPGVQAQAIAELSPGTSSILSLGTSRAVGEDVWIEVSAEGKKGWVNSRFLSEVPQGHDSAAPNNDSVSQMAPQPASADPAPELKSEDPVADCNSNEPDRRLAGCGALIGGGEIKGASLAIAYSRRSDAHLEKRHFDQAIADRSSAAQLDPADPVLKQRLVEAYNRRAAARQDAGDASGALGDYTKAIEIDPAHLPSYAGRAAVNIKSNKRDDAIADLTAARKIVGDNAALKNMLIELYSERAAEAVQANKNDSAIKDYSEAISIDPGNAELLLLRANASDPDNSDQLLQDLNEAIRLNPHLTQAYIRRAQVFARLGKENEALADLSEALKAEPLNTLALLRRGLLHEQQRDRTSAKADYEKVLSVEPSNKHAKEGVARIERAQKGIDIDVGGEGTPGWTDFGVSFPAMDQPENIEGSAGSSMWSHNGSTMKLVSDGQQRRFYYEAPRDGLRNEGVQSGTLLVDGSMSGTYFTGTARIFSRRCGTKQYKVAGPIFDQKNIIMLFGSSPQLNSACRTVGAKKDTLLFRRLEEQIE